MISDIYRIIKIRKLRAFRCYLRKSRHSAECTNAGDLFGAYILSCHLVSRMKTTISVVLLIIGWKQSAPTLIIRAPPTNEVDRFAIGDGSVYLERPYVLPNKDTTYRFIQETNISILLSMCACRD